VEEVEQFAPVKRLKENGVKERRNKTKTYKTTNEKTPPPPPLFVFISLNFRWLDNGRN
jgi:hypothetical protein